MYAHVQNNKQDRDVGAPRQAEFGHCDEKNKPKIPITELPARISLGRGMWHIALIGIMGRTVVVSTVLISDLH
jgi:hypothetical protein